MEHPAVKCLAQIVVTREDGRQQCGSGYLVAAGWVLTAAHVVRDAAAVGVWLGAPPKLAAVDGVRIAPERILFADGEVDVALLPVPGDRVPTGFVPVGFGVLDRESTDEVAVVALGFPWFKLRPLPGAEHIAGELVREVAAVAGTVIAAGNVRSGTLTVSVSGAPATATHPASDGEAVRPSVWAGMSGAGVWVSHRLIAVVGQHYLLEGAHSLTAWPVDTPTAAAGEDAGQTQADIAPSGGWREVVPNLASPPVVTPEPLRSLTTRRARRTAERLAPARLTDRMVELAELDEFAGSAARWMWVMAPAFAGKTALVAWWAAHHQVGDRVEVVGCFLRRTTGHNTAGYAVEILSGQLAGLADVPIADGDRLRLPPSEAAALMLDELLPAAVRASMERGRQLLVVVDGLDEYDSTPGQIPLGEWLPDRDTLPHGAAVLVTSRAGVAIRLRGHPLHHHVYRLHAAEAAEQIRRLAEEEIKHALRDPDSLSYPILGFLTAADSELNHHELTTLIRRLRPNLLSVQIATTWASDLARAITGPDAPTDTTDEHSSRSDAGGVYAFSHDALRAEARRLFAHDLPIFREHLHGWADDHADRGWPADTSPFLLTGYTKMLAAEADLDRLVACVTDTARHSRLRAATGADAAALAEIHAAQQLIRTHPEPNLIAMGKLAYHRDLLAARSRNLPPGLPAAWARLGQPDRAEALVRSMPDHILQSQALVELVEALADAGQYERAVAMAERAETVAGDITDSWAQALVRLTGALYAAGDRERAVAVSGRVETVAGDITDPYARVQALVRLVEVLYSAGDHERAKAVAGRVETVAGAIIELQAQVQALVGLVEVLYSAGDHERAAAVADRAETVAGTLIPYFRVEVLVGLVEVLAAAGEHERAVAVGFEAIADATADPDAQVQMLTRLVEALYAAGEHDRAEVVARAISDPAAQLWALIRMVQALADAAQYERAETVASTISDPEAQVWALIRTAQALADADECERAVAVAERAETVAGAITDPYPQAVALVGLVVALCAAEDRERAAVLAERAETIAGTITDPYPQVETLVELVEALCAAEDRERAAVLAERAETVADAIDPVGQVQALARVAEALAGAGEYDRAVAVAERADTIRRTADTATLLQVAPRLVEMQVRLVEASCAAGELERAETIARTFNGRFQVDGLVMVMEALCAAGELERAETVASTITDPHRQAEALVMLVKVLAAAGEHDRGVAVAERAETISDAITDPYSQALVLALARMVVALAAGGDHERAVAVAERAETIASTITDANSQVWALVGLVEALCAAGQHDRAETVAGAITAPLTKVHTLVGLVEALAAAGEHERAVAVAERGVAVAEQAESVADVGYSKEEALAWLVGAFGAAGEHERAETITDAITRTYNQVWALVKLVKALGAAGQHERAAMLAERAETIAGAITSTYSQAEALVGLVEALAAAGQHDRAETVASTITDPDRQAEALVGLAKALAAAGQHDRAESVASTITDPHYQAQALVGVAKAMAVAGQHERATVLAERAKTIAGAITDQDTRVQVLAELVEALAAAGQHERAETIARTITDQDSQAQVLARLAVALAAAGQHDRAEAVANTITNPHHQAQALAVLAKAAVWKNDRPHARRLIAAAWALGPWPTPLDALATADHSALRSLADEIRHTAP